MKFETLDAAVREWLLLPNGDALRLMLASIVALDLQADPIWLMVIAPPSSAKTEILQMLKLMRRVHPISTLTPRTFASGAVAAKGAVSPSLLLRLDDGGQDVLAVKDFTSILTMGFESREEILGQLREVFDGSFHKEFGTGASVEWEGKLCVLACVTPIIDMHYAVYQVLGERFLQYRLPRVDDLLQAKKAMENVGTEKVKRAELSTMVKDFMNSLPHGGSIKSVRMSGELMDRVQRLATFAVRARSGVIRDRFREIDYVPEPEAPARFTKQVTSLLHGLAIMERREEVTEEDYRLVHKVALDCITPQRLFVLKEMHKARYLNLGDLAEMARLPRHTIRRAVQDLAALGFLSPTDDTGEGWCLEGAWGEMMTRIEPTKRVLTSGHI